MTEPERSNAIKLIKKFGKMSAWYETTFKAPRVAKDGSEQEVTITIQDQGTDVSPNSRYLASAKANDGRTAGGGEGATLEGALGTVRWGYLDISPDQLAPKRKKNR